MIQAITTCNAAMWAAYGRAMVATFARHWPAQVTLTVYAEGFDGDQNGRVQFVDLDDAAPWLAPWKAKRTVEHRGQVQGRYRFKQDAVRFAHKVAAIGAAAEAINRGDKTPDKSINPVLLWLDADIVTHSPVSPEWLDGLFPANADMAWLDRTGRYPECGFMMFRLPGALSVIREIVLTYRSEAIFRLPETHDSYVIQHVVEATARRGEIKVASLSGDGRSTHHPLVNSRLAECLDHLKGDRKGMGRSRPADLVVPRSEPYWRAR